MTPKRASLFYLHSCELEWSEIKFPSEPLTQFSSECVALMYGMRSSIESELGTWNLDHLRLDASNSSYMSGTGGRLEIPLICPCHVGSDRLDPHQIDFTEIDRPLTSVLQFSCLSRHRHQPLPPVRLATRIRAIVDVVTEYPVPHHRHE